MREDWIECSLIEGCDIHDNLRKPINSKERNERINGKGEDQLYPYYGATGQVGYIDDYLTEGEYVLIGEDAAPFLDYSKDVAYQISGKTWVNNHAHILKSKFNDEFLLHYLNQFNYRDYVSGTTRLKLTQGRLKQIPIRVAPLPEQRAIVSKIEELFTDLDKGITDLKKAQQQLKVYRQAVLKKAFEGELTKEWREEQTDLPKDWIKKTIKEVCENVKVGIVIKPTQYYTDDIENGVPAFRSANVREFRVNDSNWVYFSEEGNNQNKRTQLNTGDVLIVRSGYPGTSCVVPEKFKGSNAIDILIATPNQELVTPEFLCTFNNSPFAKGLFSESSRGVAQKHLNVGVYSKLSISIPSIPEQKLILKEIESRLSVCDKVEESITESLEKAEALRQSILKQAFKGDLLSTQEIEKCKAAPDYEPAAVLLEKIKSQ